MKKIHIIIVCVVGGAIILGLLIGFAVKAMKQSGMYGGQVGVIEIYNVITTSKFVVENIKTFSGDPSIKAILVRVDSPGGGVAASQEIYEELRRAKETKKVVVSMGAVAASGGYYVALPADVIVANPGTITGSIGVIMEFPVFERLLEKIGIEFEVVKSRDHKDIGSPFRRLDNEERALLKNVIMDVYDQFVTATVDARGLPRDSVLKYADGRIITGRQAFELGFIDTLGTFSDAVDITGDLVGIEDPYLVYPPRRLSIIDYFTEPVEKLFTPTIQFLWR
ncbi:signal peptide peptidase SppA [candidate division WOR-3 bacterium]|nr:signal peptide peptidase SppA [candidate division WOR-3 bacterium]